MKVSPVMAVLAMAIVFTAGIGIGRIRKPIDDTSGEPVASQKTTKPHNVNLSDWEPIRFGRYGDADRVPGSTEAVNWLEAEHKAGRVVGQHGLKFAKQFGLARTIGIGSNVIEIELLCMDKPDGHFAILAIDPKTGVVIQARFGEYEF
jgi:hypothetical protein